jgi:hypothetical protein
MPPEGFEPTIPVFERVKTVYNLDRSATVIGIPAYNFLILIDVLASEIVINLYCKMR